MSVKAAPSTGRSRFRDSEIDCVDRGNDEGERDEEDGGGEGEDGGSAGDAGDAEEGDITRRRRLRGGRCYV